MIIKTWQIFILAQIGMLSRRESCISHLFTGLDWTADINISAKRTLHITSHRIEQRHVATFPSNFVKLSNM